MADPYVQPNGTLRNNFNISDSQELKNVEYDLTHDRLSRIHNEGPQGPFDFDRLKRTHHHIFQDVYAWAGEPRRIDLFKAQEDGIGAPLSRFDRAVVIGRNAADLFDRLAAANYLAGLPRQEFATRAADYFCEVNQLHPFREGNGRTQRAFFEALAEAAGHTLDFRGITGERMVEASIQAHDGKRDMMHRIFDEATTPNRIAALQHAVAVLDRLGFAHTDQTYVATAAPDQRYSGQFVGRDDRSFMMRADRTIIVGDPADLAAQPDRGERIAFTATGAFLAFSGAEKRQVADDIELFPTKHREAEMTSATQDQPKSAVTDRAECEELSIALDEETTRSAEPNATVPASDAAANSKRKPPAVGGFPLELERRYYVIEDSVGTARRVYADSKGEKELFRDNGDQLKTKIADSQSIKLMLDTAQHRGWEAVKVRGTEDFRREAWLEASARGVAVNGYKPTELDRQELARREKAYLRNEMTEDRVQRGRDRITEGRPARAVSEQAWPAPNYRAGVEGEVLAIGTRPYGDREGGA
ncbi:LPD7 domain-containing protein, partial [Bradyrhizobium brasilense]|uniref:LPD7 domain-containing protein n=1 Tax=Bradyrhizobium brasilense TaxID=1419277 RepID=UPI001E61BFE4